MTLDELLSLSGEPFVHAAYRAILGRDADEAGLRHYLKWLLQADGKVSMLSDLAQSREATGRALHQDLSQLPDDVFVDVIYQRLLGRIPDSGGKRNYLDALEKHGDRARVIQDLENSSEARSRNSNALKFREDLAVMLRDHKSKNGEWRMSLDDLLLLSGETFVHAAYRAILGRDADQAGLLHYLKWLERGYGKTSVLYDLTQSEEAKSRAIHQDLDPLPNDKFLDAIYQRLLGRAPDPDGKEHYLALLKKHTNRHSIISDIKGSAEARTRNLGALEFKRDLDALLREEKCAQSWWRWLGRGARTERRTNRVEECVNGMKTQLAALSKTLHMHLRELDQKFLRLESVSPLTHDCANGRPVLSHERPSPETVDKSSVFDLVRDVPSDVPGRFFAELADRIASSKEAEVLMRAVNVE